jgi:hypothetical protein
MLHVINIDKGFWWGSLKERDYLEYTDVDRRIILKK